MSEGEQSHTSPRGALVALVAGLLCAALVSSLWLFGVAGAQNESTVGDPDSARDHVTVLNDRGRFSGPGEWPPAPHEARVPHVRAARPADPERDRAIARLESHPDLGPLLGERFSLIASGHPASDRAGAAKGELDRSQLETRWFSRSTNQTVIAVSDAGGARPASVRTIAASDSQLDLSDSEDELAIALAREFWEAEGDDRIDELKGFSIWALREDGRVYDVRMAYVSFHPTREHDPELIAWVDLTNETIVRSEVVR